MGNYAKLKMNNKSIIYLKDSLKKGDYFPLIHTILENLILEKGDVIAYLPVDTKEKFKEDFTNGGLAANKNITNIWLFSEINSYLKENRDNCCIIPDFLLKPSDILLRELDTSYFIFDSQIYHYLNLEHIGNYDCVINTVKKSNALWLFLIIMTKLENSSEYLKGIKQLTIKEINILAQETEKIVVGAWDGESYLLWSKK